jgi:alkyldihydroxyacetonephosphate synthase
MRRWNGWGDDSVSYPLTESATQYLKTLVGPGTPPIDISLDDILITLPPSRLPDHPLISTDTLVRLMHSRGQSLPDWIELNSGTIDRFTDGVAFPTSTLEVRELIKLASDTGIQLIPYGGGTSVVGHINPNDGDTPVLTVDMGRMNRLYNIDTTSMLAVFGAGIAGPDLEAQLRAQDCTLGHFPQSFEYSTLGGWVATRSSGQQSLRYGRIEKLFAGGTVETPIGTMELPSFPASAAGPDLREIILGSEGRLGILTDITMRISPIPEQNLFHTVFFPSFDHGQAAVRSILQTGLPLSMLRLSTAKETKTTLALAGHESIIKALESLLSLRGLGSEKSMLLIGFSGHSSMVKSTRRETLNITGKHGGIHVGQTFGKQWYKNRFRTPYLRNTLWELGYAVDTLETALDWDSVPSMVESIETALNSAIADTKERVHVFTHLSHIYPHGSSIYTTYLFRIGSNPDETLQRWRILKTHASEAIVANKGTISHQHGVGIDHRPYLQAEKGSLGISAIETLSSFFDPQGIMNPGKLIT